MLNAIDKMEEKIEGMKVENKQQLNVTNYMYHTTKYTNKKLFIY